MFINMLNIENVGQFNYGFDCVVVDTYSFYATSKFWTIAFKWLFNYIANVIIFVGFYLNNAMNMRHISDAKVGLT